ncbi:MAG: hypothetical protein H6Q65_206 [Firmicutes bacterium]|nr:hypothetical protein [Bacillota bacterium]
MTPDEVLQGLNKLGVKLSRVSLMRYEHQDLIPKAVRENRGGPGGCYVDYPLETIFEAYAAYCLLNGKYVRGDLQKTFGAKGSKLTPESVSSIRFYYEILSSDDKLKDVKDDFLQALKNERETITAAIMNIALQLIYRDMLEEAKKKWNNIVK